MAELHGPPDLLPRPEFVAELWAQLEAELTADLTLAPVRELRVPARRRVRRGHLLGAAAAVAAIALPLATMALRGDDGVDDVRLTNPTVTPQPTSSAATSTTPAPIATGAAGVAPATNGQGSGPLGRTSPAPAGPWANGGPSRPGGLPSAAPGSVTDLGRLAYVAYGAFSPQLYTLDRGVKTLVPTAGLPFDPTWSPTGTKIAYLSYEDSVTPLRIVDLASGLDQPLATCEQLLGRPGCSVGDPTWSPNGDWIAFTDGWPAQAAPCQACAIDLVHPDGSGVHRLTTGDDAAWSPDGRQLAFTSEHDDGSDHRNAPICLIDASGAHRHCLSVRGWGVSWSPDGRSLAFAHLVDESNNLSDVWTCTVDGSDCHVVVHGEAESSWGAAWPRWSKDGQHLVLSYTSTDNQLGYAALVSVRLDGSDLRTLLDDGGNNQMLDLLR